MTKTDFFYRRISSSEFERTECEKTIIPVRLKNPFCKKSEWFCKERNEWLPMDTLGNSNAVLAEYADIPHRPAYPTLESDKILLNSAGLHDIEDMDAGQMEMLLSYRAKKQKWRFDRKNFTDSDIVRKDFAAARICTDTDALTLTLAFSRFLRNEDAPDTPCLYEQNIFFDMKNGTVRYACWKEAEESFLDREYYEDYSDYDFADAKENKKLVTDAKRYSDIENELSKLERLPLPRALLLASYKELVRLAEQFTGVQMESRRKNPPKNEILCAMYRLTLLPFEPELCEAVYSFEKEERRIKFKPRRNDAAVYNRFCKKAGIKNYRTLRKCYTERPAALFTYLHIKESGFTDLNLYNRVLENAETSRLFDGVEARALKTFCAYSIKKRGELCTMNTLLKTYKDDDYGFSEKTDAIEIFARYFKSVPERLRCDILKDGFTRFNHDALSNIAFREENKNVTFKYTAKEKSLEDDIQGYEFRLPKNSWQLCEIGTALHNCVASYAKSVEKKQCTIVYAVKDGEYRLCIEVRGTTIEQERADHNKSPDKAALQALDIWHERHKLSA